MKKKSKHHLSLIIFFSLVVFVILIGAIAVAGVAAALVVSFAHSDGGSEGNIKSSQVILFMAAISTVLGIAITFIALRVPLKPVSKLITKMDELASGDFNAKLEYGGVIEAIPSFKSVIVSFNKLSEELRNTEMLRTDFINDFSHEFKTPIASIKGFATLLKEGDLSDDEKRRYAEAIEEEASRLSDMATNVLSLSKVESKAILSDTSSFNLSEQIRACMLLLEAKWSKKNIELQIDLDEYEIDANEELLKQVWINLLDNAIKFSQRCGTVKVTVEEGESSYTVVISNSGSEIPDDKLDKIWGKFYQCDESHSSEGNGIGLAIVKHVVTLHKGEITAQSLDGWTTFSVTLPKKQ
jgi:signal transduction histidine kinase